jgi:hypothetical protein
MAAAVSFYAGANVISHLSGSGLGFYGDSGFGASVSVGAYPGKTYITNSAGSALGAEANNVRWLNAASGQLGSSGSGIALTAMPNAQATVQVRFTYDSAVKVQNCKAYGYHRDLATVPSGVTFKAAELIHPTITQLNNGSGDTTWTTLAGTGTYLTLANSPGVSGLYAGNGSDSLFTDTVHDFFLALSPSPDSLGSKLFSLYVSLEYL